MKGHIVKALVALAAFGAIAVPAQASRGLIHCRPSYLDRYYAVGNIITSSNTGCSEAQVYAWSWQKATWAEHFNCSDHHIRFIYENQSQGTFWVKCTEYRRSDPPFLRVQAWGPYGQFVSFMTTQ